MRYCLLILLSFFILLSCEETVYQPKPKAYFKIALPEKEYLTFNAPDCPYSFQYPSYASVERDSTFFDEKTEDPCWLTLNFKSLGGSIHLSYKPITATQTLFKLSEDAHKLTYKHTVKADFIDESLVRTANGVYGVVYDVGGNSASNVQFFVTDSTQHYLRGALYFKTIPNADSLEPVIKFVRDDMLKLIETIQWNNAEK